MSIFKAPKAPDPMKTAQAQSSADINTAVAQQLLNQTNQTTPWGSTEYSQRGTATYKDPVSGKTYSIPPFNQTTTLNPADQNLLNQERQFDALGNEIAIGQAGRVGETLSSPFKYGVGEHEAWAGDIYNKLNSEQDARNTEILRTRLMNQGLAEGTKAWDSEMSRLQRDQDYNRTKFMFDSQGRGFEQAVATRNQPINEMGALATFGQVQQPTFSNTPQAGLQAPDVQGLIMNQYNQQNANRNAALGGLAGLGGAALGGWAMSDKRAKKNVSKIAPLGKGLNAYSFQYKGETSPFQRLGVMAQEAEKVAPEAVAEGADGYKRVHYGKLANAMMRAA